MNAVVREIFKPSVNHAHLLVDGKGPYGLRVESDPEDHLPWLGPSSVIVRADYIEPNSYLPTLFQLMPHGRQAWARGNERSLIDRLHELMLADRGIEPPNKPDAEYWRRWHGLLRAAEPLANPLY